MSVTGLNGAIARRDLPTDHTKGGGFVLSIPLVCVLRPRFRC